MCCKVVWKLRQLQVLYIRCASGLPVIVDGFIISSVAAFMALCG